MRPIEKLVPYAKNPRTHSDAQITQIAASIAAFGFNSPILVDTESGIIAGHGRLLAGRKLGLKEVPVIILDHLSESQKRECIIADNQLPLNAGWDEETLRAELAALEAEDFNIGVIGFEDEELAQLPGQDETAGLSDAVGPESHRQQIQNSSGRIACHHRKARHSPGRGHYAVSRSVASLQRRREDSWPSRCSSLPARH
jgi:ParB-like chromosome segregation protein Spo0J